MNRDKYVGLDVDSATIVAHVINDKGGFEQETFFEANAEKVREFLGSLRGRVHVAFEEGCMAAWLYDIVRPLVSETVVCDPRRNKLVSSGNKGDRPDSANLARLLRLSELQPVYHGDRSIRDLKELVHGYDRLVRDTTRTMNRLKSIYRGQAVRCRGQAVYGNQTREEWIGRLKSDALRARVSGLYKQLDSLKELRDEAEKAMLKEARKHEAFKLLVKVPGLGPIRSSQIIAAVGTPNRFRTKRQFWPYCGLAVVTHMSGEYEIVNGQRRRRNKPIQTRGLNDNFNRILKAAFKGAAVSAIEREPFKQYYQRRIDEKMRPEMALLCVSRKIAAITLRMWKKGERFEPERVNQAGKGAGTES